MTDHHETLPPAAAALYEAQFLYEVTARHYEHAELRECEELLRTALLRFPDDGRFIQLQGLLWHSQRRYSSACRAFEIASLLVPLSHAAQLAQADVYRRCGRTDDARTILSFLVTRTDLPAILLPGLTSALGLIGEYQQALEVCRDASQRDPEQDQALYAMAYYMNKLDYPLECIAPLLRRALSLAPDSRLYRISLAVLAARSGQWQEAHTLFAPLNPAELKCQTCVRFMARVFDHQGDAPRRDAALARLEQLAEDRRRPPPTRRGRANAARARPSAANERRAMMELTRLVAVHFGVAAVMSLGFLLGPILNKAFIATADKLFARRRRRSEQWLLEVRTLEDALSERPPRRTFEPLPRTSRRPNAWR